MKRLDGKVVIVTGAGGGLGKGYARGVAGEGACVVVNDVVPETANQTVEEIKGEGGKAVACIGAVGTVETAEKLVSTAVKEFGRVDVLINNAGLIVKTGQGDLRTTFSATLPRRMCSSPPLP